MKNFKFKHEGKEYWYSRSIAAASFIFLVGRNGKVFILANKRGKGCPDFNGYWNCHCGYLDFDETLKEAASRETEEETGILISPNCFHFVEYNDDPKDSNKQNVTLRYCAMLYGEPEDYQFNLSKSEFNEVEDVKWIPITDVDSYNWAFNHGNIIKDIATKLK